MTLSLYKWKLAMNRYFFKTRYSIMKPRFPMWSDGSFEETVSSKRINRFSTLFQDRVNYLEIGIENARTFFNVRAAQKTGVDPFPLISTQDLPEDTRILFMKSDDFFKSNSLEFDLVFVDGLHTWEQTYKDIINSLNSGSASMALLVDDVVPYDAYAALRDQVACQVKKREHGIANNFWMGDVYKVLVILSKYHPELSYCTIVESDENPQCLIWRNTNRIHVEMRELAILESELKNYSYASVFGQKIPEYFHPTRFEDAYQLLGRHLNRKTKR